MGSMTQRNFLDTYVTSAHPSRNYQQVGALKLVDDSTTAAYLYKGRAFPLGATLLSAKLRVRTYETPTSRTRTLELRRSQPRKGLSRLTWNNRPKTIGEGHLVVTKTGPLVGGDTWWEFDVTNHMQAVADGAEWWGWRLVSNSALWVYGAQSGGDNQPVLKTVWSDTPDAPSQMFPDGGRIVATPKPLLRWDYTDVSGDTTMSALRVQIAGSASMTGAWDSGVVLASLPELDLSETTYPGIPGAAWWRVCVRDGANLWSEWSDAVEVKYVARDATFTLSTPAPGGTVQSPSPVDDQTPVLRWSLSGATQTAYRVRVWNVYDFKRPIWDTGRVTSTDTDIEIPSGVFRWDDQQYQIRVNVWDDLDRVSVPGSISAYTQHTVVYMNWSHPGPTDWMSARALNPWPMVELEWGRLVAPEYWVILRDHEVIARLEYEDTLQADGTHRWVDRYAPPRRECVYSVRPGQDGKVRGNPPGSGVPVVSDPVGIWLVNDRDAVCLQGVDEGTWGMGELSAIHEPISGDRVVQIRQGMRGFEGSLSGVLIGGVRGLESVTAQDWNAAFLRIKRDGGATLTASTVSVPVVTADMVAAPSPEVEEQYGASFAFWQSSKFDWDAL